MSRYFALIVKETLESSGYICLVASDGAAALGTFAKHPEIALVITDLNLPGMNGRELLETILTQRPGQRLLVASGTTEPGDYSGLAERGIVVLRKPFMPQALLSAVRDALA